MASGKSALRLDVHRISIAMNTDCGLHHAAS